LAEEHEHVKILRELAEQFKPMFEKSSEGIYLYIDEVHKICNERFARMLGLTVSEWEKLEGFVNKHAAEEDQATIIDAYQRHVHQELTPVRLRVKCVRKDGSTFKAEFDMIPFPWRGEMLALHFVREIS
jgi:PAS domain S-box-containing protein